MKRFVLHQHLIRVCLARDGWWITDRNGFKHHLPFSVQRIEAPDGLIAWRVTAWRLNVEIGKMQNAPRQTAERSAASLHADVGQPCSEACSLGDLGHCGRTDRERRTHCEKRFHAGIPQLSNDQADRPAKAVEGIDS